MPRSTMSRPAAVLALIAALALTAGCGGNDGGDSAGNDGGDSAAAAGGQANGNGQADSSAGHTGVAAEIDAVLVGIQEDFVEVDAASYCSRLSDAGVRQVTRFGEAFGHGQNCVETIDRVAKNTRDAGVEQKPTRLISVRVDGDRAFATVRNGRRPPEKMVFVDEDGWKIRDSGFEAKIGGSRALESDPAARLDQVKRFRDAIKGRARSGDGR